jgi:hypothetical protein
MTPPRLLAMLWVLGLLPGLAQAQSGTFSPPLLEVPIECRTVEGNPVRFIQDVELTDVGVAVAGSSRIVVNPVLLSRLPPWMQFFWFGHVCAHAALGPTQDEEQVDCRAVQLLKNEGLLSREEVLTLQESFESELPVPWSHKPGPLRRQALLACYDQTPEGGSYSRARAAREAYAGVKRWRFWSHHPPLLREGS